MNYVDEKIQDGPPSKRGLPGQARMTVFKIINGKGFTFASMSGPLF